MHPHRWPVVAALLPALFLPACSREKASAPSASAPDAKVEWGGKIFNGTQTYSRALGGNALACTNCHLDGGKQVGALSLVGAARKYPMDGPDGKKVSLEDRAERCLVHHLVAKPMDPTSPEVEALVAYIAWLSEGLPAGPLPAGLGPFGIDPKKQVPIRQLDAARGREKYEHYCSGCHGPDGQGYTTRRTPLPYAYVPPLWGPRSFDDASGFARVYTLAGFVRHAMPNNQPGGVTDLDAQEIAAYVDGHPRPAFPEKAAWDGALPFDAVYDTKQYPTNPFAAAAN